MNETHDIWQQATFVH